MYKRFVIIILIVYIQLVRPTSLVKSKNEITSIFEGLGYSPVCVASSLASCERDAMPDQQALYLMPELKSLIEGAKCAHEIPEQLKGFSNSLLQNITNILEGQATKNIPGLDEISNILRGLETSILDQNVAVQNITNIFEKQALKTAPGLDEINLKLNNFTENLTVLRNEISEQLNIFSNSLVQNISNILERQATKNVNGLDEVNNKLKELEAKILDQSVTIKNITENDLLAIKDYVKKATNCAESSRPSGVAIVYPYKDNVSKGVEVFCDQTTDGGNWTVIQNRDALPLREDFYRGWNEYVEGFGDLNGEFWLGLDNINALTNSAQMELRVDLEDYEGGKGWAKYHSFKIGDSSTKYTLTVSGYSGDAGDSMYYNNGIKFSTHDQDNDKNPNVNFNCAQYHKGAWWHDNCSLSNLNGFQHVGKTTNYEGIFWLHFRSSKYSLKKASLKIRPKSSV